MKSTTVILVVSSIVGTNSIRFQSSNVPDRTAFRKGFDDELDFSRAAPGSPSDDFEKYMSKHISINRETYHEERRRQEEEAR